MSYKKTRVEERDLIILTWDSNPKTGQCKPSLLRYCIHNDILLSKRTEKAPLVALASEERIVYHPW